MLQRRGEERVSERRRRPRGEGFHFIYRERHIMVRQSRHGNEVCLLPLDLDRI